MILEALNWLKNNNFDFSSLSSDSRKNVLAVNVLYAGSPSMGWSQGLWPHQGTVSNFSAGGYYIRKYQISNMGTSLNIGTFCHENGHMLFKWPDLYDYGGESSGMGQYCLMSAYGEKNPVPPCAYLRDYSGWDMVTDITDIVQGTIYSQIPNSNTSFTFRNKTNSNEMFYIESKRRTGRSKAFPDSGFMICHVDRNGSNNNEQRTASSHYMVSLEQADNLFDLEKKRNSGGRGDLFRAGYKDRFDDEIAPAALWWNGSKSGMKIGKMSGVADTMTFSIGDATGTFYSVSTSAGEHGRVSPSGRVQVVAGSTLKIAVNPDSGYQIDAITINGSNAAILDTLVIEKINSNQVITVEFGLKSALVIMTPLQGDFFYTGDTAKITWRNRGLTVQGFDLSYSKNGGKAFSQITSGISTSDSSYFWIIPDIEGDSCIVKIADRDGTPSSLSGMFSVRKKSVISVANEMISITVEKGKKITKELPVGNTGSGNLVFTATTAQQIKKVLINELSIGDPPDGFEIRNGGTDIDLSDWSVTWVDNKSTSGSYTFPKGFVLKSGVEFLLQDIPGDTGENSAYLGINLRWLFSDFLEMSISITDPAGNGVDFVKTSGSPDLPAQGCNWYGSGIELCNSFVYRDNISDNDSASDWKCDGNGTLKLPNGDRQKEVLLPPLSILPLNGNTTSGNTLPMTVTVNATTMEAGTYEDEIVIYHNDPSRPSPLRIPCVITVTEPTAVLTSRQTTPLEIGKESQGLFVLSRSGSTWTDGYYEVYSGRE